MNILPKKRNKARSNYDGGYEAPPTTLSKKAPEADIYTSDGNINFFKDLEDGKQTGASNKEHEEEKKAEQEKYEKSIGYLTYLGQDSVESKGGKAWYELDTGKITQKDDAGSEFQEVGLKSKNRMDPINDIIKYAGLKPAKKFVQAPKTTTEIIKCDIYSVPKVENNFLNEVRSTKPYRDRVKKHKKKHKRGHKKSKKCKKKKLSDSKRAEYYSDDDDDDDETERKGERKLYKGSKRKRESSSDEYDGDSRKRKKTYDRCKKRCKDKWNSKNRHSRKSRSSSSSGNSCDSSNSTINSSSQYSSEDEEIAKEKQRKLEILRAERLKREAEERRKAERLLAGKKPEAPDASSDPKPPFQQKYNSQFNPHLARQNQESKTLEAGVKYWLQ
ncbi:Leukocyte receptor cluster member 1-like [Homarus americanus]|uniref:Leukocyte receptor cluster member 1-like n=1 Tax=Homarus americanus TaxID=6706 RepID=A0A8J5N988_HOMAM|nr:Leukocyte receptor cluster member 1-like [Homarus americanus]